VLFTLHHAISPSSHTNSAVIRQVYAHALLVHAKFMHMPCISFGMVQHQKQLVCRESRKIN